MATSFYLRATPKGDGDAPLVRQVSFGQGLNSVLSFFFTATPLIVT